MINLHCCWCKLAWIATDAWSRDWNPFKQKISESTLKISAPRLTFEFAHPVTDFLCSSEFHWTRDKLSSNQTARYAAVSATRIGRFLKILCNKVSQKRGNFLGYFVKPNSFVKTAVTTLWTFLGNFGLFFNLVTLLAMLRYVWPDWASYSNIWSDLVRSAVANGPLSLTHP